MIVNCDGPLTSPFWRPIVYLAFIITADVLKNGIINLPTMEFA